MSDIKYPDAMGQLLDFEGLTVPGTKLRPTDIDVMLDLKGLGWLIGELKGQGARFPMGQRILLTRLGDQLQGLRVAFVATHLIAPPEPVFIKDALTYLTRRNAGEWLWHQSDVPTVQELWDDTLREVGL